MNEALECYETFLKKGDTVIAAVSFGPDSMALLSSLVEYRKKVPMEIICAHVNHKVRKESDEEEVLLKEYCDKEGVFFEVLHLEKQEKKENFQAYARKMRYEFFSSLFHKYHASYLMTAHHADDLMETILMRMVRGSTLRGYSGFGEVAQMNDVTILRPFICCTKEELLNYVVEHKIPYANDASNQKEVYTRNRYRKHILPFLKEEDENVHKKFYEFHRSLEEYADYVDQIVSSKSKKIIKNHSIFFASFLKEETLIQKELIKKLLKDYYKEEIDKIQSIHVDRILHLIHEGKSNAYITLPNQVLARRGYHDLTLTKERKSSSYDIILEDMVEIGNKKIFLAEESSDDSNFTCRLSLKEIALPIHVRSKKIGDKMEVKGLSGRKKVSDILNEKKILMSDRNCYPIVCDSKDHILWIPGLKKSKFDKTKKEKYDIILRVSVKGDDYE